MQTSFVVVLPWRAGKLKPSSMSSGRGRERDESKQMKKRKEEGRGKRKVIGERKVGTSDLFIHRRFFVFFQQ